jgi:(1->4)-alpha-D-glucan 1-alpha-D-glucosylmutase
VDPDNRRPVDFATRREMLSGLRSEVAQGDRALLALANRLARDPCDPRLKLFVTWRTLQLRRRHARLFQSGDYVPLEVQGARARHVCALARIDRSASGSEPAVAIVAAPRLIAQLTPWAQETFVAPPPLGAAVWGDTCLVVEGLPSSPLENAFTGQVCAIDSARLPVASLLSDFPVALATNLERLPTPSFD